MKTAVVMLSLLPPVADATGLTVRWQAPTNNTDGSELTDLAGYVVQYRRVPNLTWRMKKLEDPWATEWTTADLTPGIWQFRVRAYNSSGAKSKYTHITEKELP
jgi:hypothetical protein